MEGETAQIWNIGLYCILVLLCLVCYQHSVDGSFVFDDVVAVVNNQDVNSFPTNLSAIFMHDFWGTPLIDKNSHKSYRPLTTLMFHIEYAHWNMKSKDMKLINLLLHCLNTMLACKFLCGVRLPFLNSKKKQRAIASVTSVLFAVHPIHTEAVCGIVGRAELMFCLCYLLALLLVTVKNSLVLKNKIFTNSAIVLTAFAGMLFKETAIMILPTCIFINCLQKKLLEKPMLKKFRALICRRNLFWFAVCLVMLLWRLWLQNFESPRFKPMDNPIAFKTNFLSRFLSQNYLYSLNCWLLLCPQWLSFDWAVGCVQLIKDTNDIRIISCFTLYGILLLVFWYSKNDSYLLLGVGLLIIPFLPASGLIKVGFVIAERVLYVPSLGFCLIVANSFIQLKNHIKRPIFRILHKTWLILLIILFVLRTRSRALEWSTEEILFSSALAVCPTNAKVHYNVARLASGKLHYPKAFYHYHQAIELYPDYESALMNLGNLYREIGNLSTAEKYLTAALEVLPEFPAAWMNLGIVQSANKDYTKAMQSYRNALKYRKYYPICYYNMGNLFLDMKNYNEAICHWKESVTLNPRQPKAWVNILTMLDSQGLLEDAIRLSATALNHLPNETTIMFIRANVFGKLQKYNEAERLYRHLIDIEPLNILYHTNMGVLYHRWGRLNAAIDSYQRAFQLNPVKAKTAHDNLSILLRRIHDRAN